MLGFVFDFAVFFVLYVFSGLVAVFFTWRYLSRSWMQLVLGYLGAVGVATGVSTSLLGFTPVFSVILALGVSAALTGFGIGVYVLNLLKSSTTEPDKRDMNSDDEEDLGLYDDEMVRRTVSLEEERKDR